MIAQRVVIITIVATMFVLLPVSASISDVVFFFSEEYTASLSLERALVMLDHLFELRKISDGADSQWVHIGIGSFIVTQPKAFLIALSKYPDAVVRLGSIVGNLGTDYVDKVDETISVLERRYNAILSVGNEVPLDAKIIVLLELAKSISFLRDILVHCYYSGPESDLISTYRDSH